MSLLFPGPEMTPVAMPRALDGPWIEGAGIDNESRSSCCVLEQDTLNSNARTKESSALSFLSVLVVNGNVVLA